MWPAENTTIDEFGTDYTIQVAYDVTYNLYQINYIIKTPKTVSELKTYLGNMVFGEPMTETYQDGNFIGETNDRDDPLFVMIYIEETASGNYISLYFRFNYSPESFYVLYELVDIYMFGNSIITADLTQENYAGEGFEYDFNNGKSAVYSYWLLEYQEARDLLDEYKAMYQEYPGFIDERNSGNPKQISFTYDIWGDGETKCVAYIQAFNDGYFSVKFGNR